MGRGGGRQVSAGGEPEDAHAPVQAPGVGAGAHGADGALSVAERRGVLVTRGMAVGQDETRHAEGVEPFGDGGALVGSQSAVAAARTHDDRGARHVLPGGEKRL